MKLRLKSGNGECAADDYLTDSCVEEEYLSGDTVKYVIAAQGEALHFLYGSVPGRMCLKVLARPALSKIAGVFMNSPASTPLIKHFVRSTAVNLTDYEEKKYKSYNEFFTRKIKADRRPVDYVSDHLISPCDAKLTAYVIDEDSVFHIKGSCYTVSDLLQNETLAAQYHGGYCLIFRLTVDDYHRYCYIDDGDKEDNIFIKGELHTVQSIALEKYNIYKRNCREYSVLHTENFGDVIQVEVGAMLVGKICNHHGIHRFKRGEEKGLFEFGGSTIVLLLPKGVLTIDEEILHNTASDGETVVRLGEKIGQRLFN